MREVINYVQMLLFFGLLQWGGWGITLILSKI
jgi:hypothetical protein